jgi:hypothetical protein
LIPIWLNASIDYQLRDRLNGACPLPVISNSDYPDHAAIAQAMRDYVRWCNRNADDKELRKTPNSTRTL